MSQTPEELKRLEQARLAAIRANRLGVSDNRRLLLDENVTTFDEMTADVESYANNLAVDWSRLALQDIPNAFGESMQSSLDTVAEVISVLKSVVSVVKAAAEFTIAFVGVVVDFVKALYNAAVLLLEAILDAILGTKGAYIMHYPRSVKEFYTLPRFLDLLSASYDDKGDLERPIAVSPSDTHLFFGMFVVGPDPRAMIDAIKQLVNLFSPTGEQIANLPYVTDIPVGAYPYNLYEAGASTSYPDWSGYQLADMPLLVDVVAGIGGLLSRMRTVSGADSAIIAALTLIERKLTEIEAIIARILNVLQQFVNLTAAPLNTLAIYGPANIQAFQSALRGSTQLETYPLRLNGNLTDAEFVAFSFCLHFTLGTGKAIDFVKALFNIGDLVNPDVNADPEGKSMLTRMSKAATKYRDTQSTSKADILESGARIKTSWNNGGK